MVFVYNNMFAQTYGGFLKWWYPTTMGFPTKNDHFGVFWRYHHLRKQPYGFWVTKKKVPEGPFLMNRKKYPNSGCKISNSETQNMFFSGIDV